MKYRQEDIKKEIHSHPEDRFLSYKDRYIKAVRTLAKQYKEKQNV